MMRSMSALVLLTAMVMVAPPSWAEPTWATHCTLVVDGVLNDGNEDSARAEGPPDCMLVGCAAGCRVQLGQEGVLECENLDVPGGWIAPVSGDNNDFTVFEMMEDETYRVLVEDPGVPGTWVLAGEGGLGGPRSFDLPDDIPFTNRVRIEDKGESLLWCPDRGADIDAIGSGEVAITDCSYAPWAPSFPCSSTVGGTRVTSDRINNLAVLLFPSVTILLFRGRRLPRR